METVAKYLDINSSVEYLFEEEVYLTKITEFGVSWEELLSGKAQLPLQGARFNIEFEGRLTGNRITGTVKGTDFLYIRANGSFQLNLQATILTDDGVMIQLQEDGALIPMPDGNGKLNLNMRFSTASEKYNWINLKTIWGVGEVNMSKGIVHVTGYSN